MQSYEIIIPRSIAVAKWPEQKLIHAPGNNNPRFKEWETISKAAAQISPPDVVVVPKSRTYPNTRPNQHWQPAEQ